MKKILVVSGSRADYGMLEWPVKVLREDGAFEVWVENVWGYTFEDAFLNGTRQAVDIPDLLLVLGDRYEILATVTAAHLQRIPIAHIAGGDVTEGSYDDAMRDCISRMASIHFVTSTSAMARLTHMGCKNVHLTGSPGIDYIRHAGWKRERPIAEPYVVVSYQAETIDGGGDVRDCHRAIAGRRAVVIRPNPDRGSDEINKEIDSWGINKTDDFINVSHAEFLNLIYHCDEFIGNSSAMLYEAPELGVKTRMIGKRQRGRTIPMGDGNASERILHVLKYGAI